MKYILNLMAVICLPGFCHAQTFYNNGAVIHNTSGSTLFVNGNFSNATGSDLRNNGTLEVKGDITNNQLMSSFYGGTLILSGSTLQTLSGSNPLITNKLTINNGDQVNCNLPVIVNNECKFIDAVFNTPSSSAPLRFTQNGFISVSNPPYNGSHVNGYVIKDGTGNFEYPVGDGIQYQKVDVNLSSNPNGMRVKYFAGNAGSGPFTNGGSSTVPLIEYNETE